jgi:hypothetical protein
VRLRKRATGWNWQITGRAAFIRIGYEVAMPIEDSLECALRGTLDTQLTLGPRLKRRSVIGVTRRSKAKNSLVTSL